MQSVSHGNIEVYPHHDGIQKFTVHSLRNAPDSQVDVKLALFGDKTGSHLPQESKGQDRAEIVFVQSVQFHFGQKVFRGGMNHRRHGETQQAGQHIFRESIFAKRTGQVAVIDFRAGIKSRIDFRRRQLDVKRNSRRCIRERGLSVFSVPPTSTSLTLAVSEAILASPLSSGCHFDDKSSGVTVT